MQVNGPRRFFEPLNVSDGFKELRTLVNPVV